MRPNRNAINPPRLAIAASFLICCLTVAVQQVAAQEKGVWRAASKAAQSITGDVALADQKIAINFLTFTMVKIRALDKSELSAAFDADANANGSGSLYKLNVPAAKKIMGHNTLCGDEDTEWMATYVAGNSLHLAFFSGEKPPVFTLDAISNSTDLCGTYSYIR
jgi:hypothetical protein